ncbi:MAG TPA: ABC transporter permease [archaeon]|nr:ABC transporter permease [archaeon]
MHKYAKPALFLMSCLIIWNIISNSGIVSSALFPSPFDVLVAFIDWNSSGKLLIDVTTSLWRLIVGTIIGVILGVIVGLAMGISRTAEETAGIFFHLTKALPPIALIPLIILWFGIGDIGKIFLVAFAAFFPSWISALTGAKSIPVHYINTARLFSKSNWESYSKVILPATMPFLINGGRIAIAIGFTMVFASELAGASEGIGYFIAIAQIIYRPDMMIAGLIVLGLLAATVDYFFVRAARFAFPWVEEI